MALLVSYRVLSGDLQVFFHDIRQEGAVEHLCVLPDEPSLIVEITDQLTAMGFELEFDRKLDHKGELRILASHLIPDGAGSSAEAIRTVCRRHEIEAAILTGKRKALRFL